MRSKSLATVLVAVLCVLVVVEAYLVTYYVMLRMSIVELTFHVTGNNIEVRPVLNWGPFVFLFLVGFLVAMFYVWCLFIIAERVYPIKIKQI